MGIAGALLVVLAPVLVLAQAEIVPGRIDPPRTVRHHGAMEAGHVALYLCSGLFLTGLPREFIERDSMFDQIAADALPGTLSIDVDYVAKVVRVGYLASMPPRIAAWRPGLGCAQLPVGAAAQAIDHLPKLPEHVIVPDLDAKQWPLGDADAHASLPHATARSLEAVIDNAFDGRAYGGITWGIVVVKDGYIVGERYERGYDMHSLQRTHSAAKSIAATVLGVAVQQGLLDVHAPAPIPEWHRPGDPRAAITLSNLLHMGSGLYTEGGGNPQQEIYLAGAAVAERSIGNVLDAMPGERYVYAGSDTLIAVRSLREVLADDPRYLRFPYEELLWKLGMTRTVLETDWQGDYLMSGQAYASARDFARLGLLYLNGGRWNGEQLLPDDWPDFVSRPAPAQPTNSWANPDCANSCTGRAYGAQFWIPTPNFTALAGAYMASGGRGQYMLVIPERNVIVVRRGTDTSRRQTDATSDAVRFDIEQFAVAVLAALDGTSVAE
jgi:CubicO group peptidase (beta-lactamase class C family)